MSELQTLKLDRPTAQTAVCTFNRPEVRNALNVQMVGEIRQVLQTLAADKELRVLVFTGAGEKAFISGADIAELRARTKQDTLGRINSSLFREIEEFPLPTIAAVRGACLGGGCELAAACDIRIAGHGASFGQPEVKLGIIPAAGAIYRLPRLIGLGRAKELIFTGRILKAPEALAMGLVNECVDDGQVLGRALEIAASIAKNGALAVRLAKSVFNSTAAGETETAQNLETLAQAVLTEDPEMIERMTAFLERKKK